MSVKAAAVKQRDTLAAQIAELEAVLENTGVDGGLQNGFITTFGKYVEIEEITGDRHRGFEYNLYLSGWTN